MAKNAGEAAVYKRRMPLKQRLTTLPHRLRLALRKYWFIYLLALPGIIFLLLFSYGPMYGILLAFKDFKINKGVWGSPWVGLLHYKELFSDPAFIQAFKNTVIINVYHLIFGFSFNVFLALMINELQFRRVKNVVQTCVYLPYFLSWVIFAGLVQVFLQAPVPGDVGGVVNQIIVAFGGEAIDFMKRPELFRGILVVTNIIKTAGYSTIIYLAAIAGVDPTLYEAAAIDGASVWQMFWKIYLPFLRPLILLNTIYTLVQLSAFSSNEVNKEIVNKMTLVGKTYGYSSALAWIYFVCMLAVLGVAFLLLRERKESRRTKNVFPPTRCG